MCHSYRSLKIAQARAHHERFERTPNCHAGTAPNLALDSELEIAADFMSWRLPGIIETTQPIPSNKEEARWQLALHATLKSSGKLAGAGSATQTS